MRLDRLGCCLVEPPPQLSGCCRVRLGWFPDYGGAMSGLRQSGYGDRELGEELGGVGSCVVGSQALGYLEMCCQVILDRTC